MKSDIVMLDSCLWIDFFRDKNFKHAARIEYLLPEKTLAVNGIILAEVLGGAKSDKEANLIKEAMLALIYIEMPINIFSKAASIFGKLRKSGLTVPLADAIIGASCLEKDITLLTYDIHFKPLCEQFGLKLEILD